jgi:hypothetical protein
LCCLPNALNWNLNQMVATAVDNVAVADYENRLGAFLQK